MGRLVTRTPDPTRNEIELDGNVFYMRLSGDYARG